MRKILKQCLNDESGATAIEYALIASLIAIVIVTSVQAVGTSLIDVFDDVADGLS